MMPQSATYDDVKSYLSELGANFNKFRSDYDRRLEELEAALAKGQLPACPARAGGLGTVDPAAAREHGTAFMVWARRGTDPEGLRALEVRASLSTVSDPDGGYLVPVHLDQEIDRLATAAVAMRRIARVVHGVRGDYKRPISMGGTTGGWVAEKGSRTETETPELAMFAPAWGELYALPKVAQRLLDDADFDVEGWLTEEIAATFTETEGTAFISGNGVGQPRGILNYETVADTARAWGKIGYIAGGHATLLSNADKLFAVQHALKPVYRNGAVWLMNDTTLEAVRTFKDGLGNYLVRPGLAEAAPDTLLGRPVVIDDIMPSIGANTYPIAFGDFQRAYTIVDHAAGTRLLRDPYTSKGNVQFFVTRRVAGGLVNHQAVKLLKIATT